MSRIALDLRMLVEPPDGISRYALELALRVPSLMPEHEIAVLGDRERLAARLPGRRAISARSTSISAFEQAELTYLLARGRIDLFHATLFVAPLVSPARVVMTLHDVNYLALPRLYGWHRWAYFQAAVRAFAHQAEAVVTVSEFSRREIASRLGVAEERIEVVYNGVDERFRPRAPEEIERHRQALGLPSEYLLYVGSFAPHKAVPTLLGAYARLRDAPPLVLCGRCPESIRPEIERRGLGRRVMTLPGQDDAGLPLLYSGATAFVFPSRYEGFGLPPVEAMACGVATIVSDAASLPEVTGGGALTFPVGDEAALAHRLEEVLGSPSKRAEIAQAGRRRAAEFKWERCAERLAAIYRAALAR